MVQVRLSGEFDRKKGNIMEKNSGIAEEVCKNKEIEKNKKNKLLGIYIALFSIVLGILFMNTDSGKDLFYSRKNYEYTLNDKTLKKVFETALESGVFPESSMFEETASIYAVSKDWTKSDDLMMSYYSDIDGETVYVEIDSTKFGKDGFYELYCYKTNSYITWQKEKTNVYNMVLSGDKDNVDCTFDYIDSTPIAFENGSLVLSEKSTSLSQEDEDVFATGRYGQEEPFVNGVVSFDEEEYIMPPEYFITEPYIPESNESNIQDDLEQVIEE